MKFSVVCFDLDGTISEEGYDKQPIQEMVEVMKKLKNRGIRVVIYTSRHDKKRTVEWLERHRIPHDKIVFGKPAADIYVDDKGVKPKDFLKMSELEELF